MKCSCRNCTLGTFEKWLSEEHGLKRVPVPSDGNCLFHALSMYGEDMNMEMTHLTVRREIVEYIRSNPDTFRTDIEFGTDYGTLENYIEHLHRPGVWGDAIMLHAFAIMYNVNVVIFTPPKGYCELFPDENRSRIGLIRIGEHYEATKTCR